MYTDYGVRVIKTDGTRSEYRYFSVLAHEADVNHLKSMGGFSITYDDIGITVFTQCQQK